MTSTLRFDMTTPHRTLQMALDALDRAISDDRAYIRECKDAAEAIRAHLAAQPAPAEPVNREHAIALRDAELYGCEDMYFAARPQIDTLQARRIYAAGFKAGYEVRPPAQPLRAEPVALESVHLTRDINGMCTVRVNGRIAIHDNGDIIDHMATLEWFAQPAPVPLTDTETHAELWKLAVRKGLITVRSELIDPRNHGTRVSWMQGHDKACDISNDAAAHGIAASPEQPK